MKQKNSLIIIVILAGIGALLSVYLVATHYAVITTACKVGGAINCDLVNRGPYGEIFGFPVAGLGLLGYLAFAVLAVMLLRKRGNTAQTLTALRALTTAGFAFSLYLLYLELFVILAVCTFCMVSLILITIIMTLAWTVEPRAQPNTNAAYGRHPANGGGNLN